MADGAVQVTFAQIEDMAGKAGSTNSAIQALLDDLYRQVAPLFATWAGAAAETFQYQHQQWANASDDLNTVLRDIATLLLETHDSYSQAEAEVATIWTA
ncbi:WXG100 family type VII secretion target [Actinospica sp.]|jgi:WXG100 family type VII secretion target|uniref:WXG100 family type VII secretion target n=1 Tax=Actinospica sp. TaxID=1872142 RepID=UPI002C47F896|nr:WXG100 family type VII secretion target [Actinospica sp.]HWG28397.1 WXG100 family type VII secretion target [Actinospica sp.]